MAGGVRSAGVLSAAATVALASGDAAGADGGPVTRFACRHEAAPGRVLCAAEMEWGSGRVAWADAVVRSAPEFARPLRTRVAAAGSVLEGSRVRFELAFVAADTGSGVVDIDVRAVHCLPRASGGERCVPVAARARATLGVGPIRQDGS